MITTRNMKQHHGGIANYTDRAAHLVQALENCPLEFIVATLAIFDNCNSKGAKSPSAKRWIRQFAGFDASKKMEPIIEVLNNGQAVDDKETLKELMKHMKNVA